MLDKTQEYSSLITLFCEYYRLDRNYDLKSITQKLISLRKYQYYETTRQAVRKIHEDLYLQIGISISQLAKYLDEQTNMEARNMLREQETISEKSKDMKIAVLETKLDDARREIIELRYDNLTLEEKNKKLKENRKALKINTKEALAQIALIDLIGAKDAYVIQHYNEAIAIIAEGEGIELYTSNYA